MQQFVRIVTALALTLFGAGIGFADDSLEEIDVSTATQGFVAAESRFDVEETVSRLTDSLESNPNINVLGVVDHAAAAASVGLELAPTRVIFFGNPALGTPLMQQSRSVGIDLPQKLMVWEASDGTTYVGYNTPAYLVARHGLPADLGQLSTINGALSNFASTVTDRQEGHRQELAAAASNALPAGALSAGAGLLSVTSSTDFETTVSNLESTLEERGFRVPFVVPHSQAAAAKDFELGPTTLFVFGNPNVGTPLMREERRVAVDLPQKMLVWEDEEGTVRITYNEPAYLLARHDVSGLAERAATIAGALAGIAQAAAE